jgi:ABC-type Fe3+ transport system permease subunit
MSGIPILATLIFAIFGTLLAVMVTLGVLWSMGRSSRRGKGYLMEDKLTQTVRLHTDLAR